MSILHYRLAPLSHSWLLTCEAVPIAEYPDRDTALAALTRLIKAARSRGDRPLLAGTKNSSSANQDRYIPCEYRGVPG